MLPDLRELFADRRIPPTKRELRRQEEEKARQDYLSPSGRERRQLIFHDLPRWAVGITATGAGLWWLATREPGVEDLVLEAKQLENNYTRLNLNNIPIRNRYTQLIAGIFSQYFPSDYSPNALVAATTFVPTKGEFDNLYTSLHHLPSPLSDDHVDALKSIYGFTIDGRVYIDTTHPSFHSSQIITSQGKPILWTPLKTLRMGTAHEYGHLIVNTRDNDMTLAALYPRQQDRYVEGFRIRNRKSSGVRFWELDEAAVELLAAWMNNAMFGSWRSDYILHGKDVTLAARNLHSILRPANISAQTLSEYHRHSQLDDFLLSLVEKSGVPIPQASKDNFKSLLEYGIKIATAIIENDERFLVRFIKDLETRKN